MQEPSLNSIFFMAKKSATPLVAATGSAPKSTLQKFPALPCALKYFWQYALLAWGYCRENLPLFAAERPYFTEEFIDDEVAYINTTKALPNNTTRRSLSKEQLLALKANRQTVFDEGQRLGLAIDFAYREDPKEVAAVQRTAAGLDDLSAASRTNWAAVSTFIDTAKGYLAANNATLVAAGAINATFTTNFTTVGNAFNAVWNSVLLQRKTAKDGTKAVADGIQRIKDQLDPMLKLGSETIFKYDPAKRQLFTTDDLVASVRGGHTAGIKGRTDWAANGSPVAGILVTVLNEEGKTAVTDAKGRYEIKLAAGQYTVRFTAANIEPLELQVVTKAGVNRRLNVLLTPPLPMSAALEDATTPTPKADLSSALKASLREVGTPDGTPQHQNGVPQHQNGVHAEV